MFARISKFIAGCVVLLAMAVGSPPVALAQHGGGGHGGGGHGGGGHGGFSHGGFSHGGYGHGGSGHIGSYGHGSYGHRSYGHSLYSGHSSLGSHGSTGYRHYTPYFGLHYSPWYGHYGYGGLGYGTYYWPYGSTWYGQSYTTAYPPTTDSLASVQSTEAGVIDPAADYLPSAENAFRAGNYAEAVRLANHAAVDSPRNGRLYLFVSQTLFATGEYQGATAALYQATTLLEPKDWGYVVQNFRDYYRNDDYVRQMDRLTKFIEENPKAAFARTLRGYHYGFLGHKEAAERDLAKAVELEKRDKLASQLLTTFGGTAAANPPALK